MITASPISIATFWSTSIKIWCMTDSERLIYTVRIDDGLRIIHCQGLLLVQVRESIVRMRATGPAY